MRFAFVLCLVAGTLAAQDFPRATISAELTASGATGPILTTDSLSTPRGGASLGLGFHLTPHVTLETGLDWICRPLGSAGAIGYGYTAGDQLYLVPVGARYGFGPRDGRWRIYAGLGGAIGWHTFPTVSNAVLDQTGFGGYFLTGADAGIGRHVRLGGQLRFYHMAQVSNLVQLGLTPANFVTAGPQLSFTF